MNTPIAIKRISTIMTVVMMISAFSAPWAAAAKPPLSIKNAVPRFATKVNATCASWLTDYVPGYLHKPIKVAGHIVPVIPMFKTLADADNLFYVFIETPLIGLVNTPVSSALAVMLSGHPLVLDGKFVQNTKEVYVSYQSANVVRNGVSIQKDLSPKVKVWLNWWYSTAIYAWATAAHKLAEAHTPDQKAYAYSLIAFAGLWPLFSQRVGQYILTPMLFSKFPKKSLLNDLNDPSKKLAELAGPREEKITALQTKLDETAAKLEAANGARNDETKALKVELKKTKSDLDIAKAELKWIKWFRKEVKDGEKVAWSRNANYWAQKTGVSMVAAISMVTIYFIARWALVGENADDDKTITKVFKAIMKNLDPKTEVSEEDLKHVPALIREQAEAVRQNPAILTAPLTPPGLPTVSEE